jgi:hypothetical protein
VFGAEGKGRERGEEGRTGRGTGYWGEEDGDEAEENVAAAHFRCW